MNEPVMLIHIAVDGSALCSGQPYTALPDSAFPFTRRQECVECQRAARDKGRQSAPVPVMIRVQEWVGSVIFIFMLVCITWLIVLSR
jgi:hypothetical protein